MLSPTDCPIHLYLLLALILKYSHSLTGNFRRNTLKYSGIGDSGATALASALRVNQSLTTLK